MLDQNTNQHSLPQKLKETFNKKLINSLAYQQFKSPKTINSIIAQGSKGSQRIFSRKTTQNTYIQQNFQNQEDYIRQKLLIMTLNTMGKYTENTESLKLEQSINEYPNSWKYHNPRYPYLTGYNDQELQLEIQIGMASLTSFRRYRYEQNIRWQDKEIQYLMKSLCKIVTELYNCGIYHCDICLDHIYFRKNLIGSYEAILTDYCDATNNYQTLNGYNPDYQNFQGQEATVFANKENRLKHELYQVGRVIQKCMLDLETKQEVDLFTDQSLQGIEKCLSYLKQQKSQQFSRKTLECLEILLKKGNLETLIKKFKKFNKQQMIVDNEKIIDQIFNHMCVLHPPLETIKKATNNKSQNANVNSSNTSFLSTNESEEEEHKKPVISLNTKNQYCLIYQEQQLQKSLIKMKEIQEQQEKKMRKYSDNTQGSANNSTKTLDSKPVNNININNNNNDNNQNELNENKQKLEIVLSQNQQILIQCQDKNLEKKIYNQENEEVKNNYTNENEEEDENENYNDSDWDIVSFHSDISNSSSSFEEI